MPAPAAPKAGKRPGRILSWLLMALMVALAACGPSAAESCRQSTEAVGDTIQTVVETKDAADAIYKFVDGIPSRGPNDDAYDPYEEASHALHSANWQSSIAKEELLKASGAASKCGPEAQKAVKDAKIVWGQNSETLAAAEKTLSLVIPSAYGEAQTPELVAGVKELAKTVQDQAQSTLEKAQTTLQSEANAIPEKRQ